MKRTLERITFMIVGALIAFVAYSIGNMDGGAEAQEGGTKFDRIVCDRIFAREVTAVNIVGEQITLSNKEGNGGIALNFKDGNPNLEMGMTSPKGCRISMQAKEDGAAIAMTSNDRPTHFRDAGIFLVSSPAESAIFVEKHKIAYEKR